MHRSTTMWRRKRRIWFRRTRTWFSSTAAYWAACSSSSRTNRITRLIAYRIGLGLLKSLADALRMTTIRTATKSLMSCVRTDFARFIRKYKWRISLFASHNLRLTLQFEFEGSWGQKTNRNRLLAGRRVARAKNSTALDRLPFSITIWYENGPAGKSCKFRTILNLNKSNDI